MNVEIGRNNYGSFMVKNYHKHHLEYHLIQNKILTIFFVAPAIGDVCYCHFGCYRVIEGLFCIDSYLAN